MLFRSVHITGRHWRLPLFIIFLPPPHPPLRSTGSFTIRQEYRQIKTMFKLSFQVKLVFGWFLLYTHSVTTFCLLWHYSSIWAVFVSSLPVDILCHSVHLPHCPSANLLLTLSSSTFRICLVWSFLLAKLTLFLRTTLPECSLFLHLSISGFYSSSHVHKNHSLEVIKFEL